MATIPPKKTPFDHWSINRPKAIPVKMEIIIGYFNLFQFLFWISLSEMSLLRTDFNAIKKNIRYSELKNTSPMW